MSDEAHQSVVTPIDRLVEQFEAVFGSADGAVLVRAPGRVNLIGDHTDYNDGFVLPTTIDRAVYAAVRPTSDETVDLYSSNFADRVRYPLPERPPTDAGSWTSYVTGAVEELRLRGYLSRGFEMLVYGDVPLGAGLSSSAALETAVVYGLDVIFGLDLDPIESIRLCQTVEHRYAGVECGIMDQFVSRLGRTGHALLLDCRSLEYEHVPLALTASDLALVIADSRVHRELAGSKYGERRAECRRAVETARQLHPGVDSLRDLTPDLLRDLHPRMEEHIYRRARHVLEENERVLQAGNALRDAAFDRFGELMNRSHDSLRDLFEVSIAELDVLVAAAQQTGGVLGARMTGGGFGGATVHLVRRDAVDDLKRALSKVYRDEFGREPAVYVMDRNFQTEIILGPEEITQSDRGAAY